MVKSMLENGEVLILSYGMGLYRILSLDDLSLENNALNTLKIVYLLKTGENSYIGMANEGHFPSLLERKIHQTDEFLEDQKFAMINGSQLIKDRFYELYKRG